MSSIERRYTNAPVHQAYIEPHACVVSVAADGQCTIWSSSQGQFMVRAYCAKLLGIDISNIRAIPAEIGGGFGGKTLVYLEPVALALSKKTGRPVKMVMSREEVFRGTGPAAGGVIEVKLGAKKDGTLDRRPRLVLKYQAGAFPGSPVGPGCMCAFAMYDIPNVKIIGYDVVSATARRSRPTARPARRTRLSGSKAASTNWPISSASTRWRCARRTPPRTAPRRCTGRPGQNIGYAADPRSGQEPPAS